MHPAEAKALSGMLIDGLEREYAITRKIVAAIPESQLDFKLGEKGRTTRELAWHLISSETWFAEGILTGTFSSSGPEPPDVTVAGMLAYYDNEVTAAIAKVRAMSGEDLAKIVSFMGVMEMPNVLYLGFWNNHSIHHRGQLSTYLRAMNAHVPGIYGGSADEPFTMPATA